MIDPIEKVARAIHGAANNPFAFFDTPEMQRMREEQAQAAITAYKEALREAGYVIVPVEPTEAMLQMGQGEIYDQSGDTKASEIWEAMSAAAQETPDAQ